VTKPFAVAHRAPASAEACAELQAAGASVFELDVRLSPRGVVVSHFLALPRPLARVERDNWRLRRGRDLGQDPLLADALQLLPSGARVLLDLKEAPGARSRALCAELVRTLPDPERWSVSTDAVDDVARMRAAGFDVWRTARNRAGLRQLISGGMATSAVSIRHTLLDSRVVGELRAQGADVVAWTVNSMRRARYLLDIGVRGITTDSSRVVAAVASAAR
jgi:hypothetical protein